MSSVTTQSLALPRLPEPSAPAAPAPATTAAATTAALAGGALACFTANALLGRIAVAHVGAEPASFALLRVVATALALGVVAVLAPRPGGADRTPATLGRWSSAALLVVSVLASTWGLQALTAGTGALLFFAAVQVTMLGGALADGERPRPLQWLGAAAALLGLAALVAPGVAAPPLLPGAAIAGAGAAWGVYSRRGRGVADALGTSAANHLRAVPLVLAAAPLLLWGLPEVSAGVLTAALAAGVSSSLGNVAWYAAMPRLTSARAGALQLAVPVLTALAGAALLGEVPSARTIVCGAVVLVGVGLAMTRR